VAKLDKKGCKMEIKKCPVCNDESLTTIFQAPRYPYFGFSILQEEKEALLHKYTKEEFFSALKIVSCNNCRHVFQAINPDEELMEAIYSQYYNYPSPMLSGFAQERENIFLDFFLNNISPICKKKKLNRILEIACFDGFVLKALSEKGFQVCGCDPSKGADIANDFGIKVHKRYFESSYFTDKKELFDIVIFRHFIEHIPDPIGFMMEVKKVLNKDGLIIFETPDVENYLKNGSFESFHLQHLQNFSIYSVSEVLKRASLKLISYKMSPENMIIVASENGGLFPDKSNLWQEYINNFKRIAQRNIVHLKDYIRPFLAENKKIVLWGAGTFCGEFFSLYGMEEVGISYVVDIDQRKWNMGFMNNDLKIYSPEKLLSDDVDLIIITSTFTKEITQQIRQMNIQSTLISMHPKVNLIKEGDLCVEY
jgi:SAM-dependent methyltransferase